MTDIVDELRSHFSRSGIIKSATSDLVKNAAAEIERLQDEVVSLGITLVGVEEVNALLRAENATLLAAAQAAWQPIDRFNPEPDNPNVLVSDQGTVSEAYYDGEADAWFKAGKSEHDFDFVSSDRLYPSHWMPLPAPPALSSAERAKP